MPTESNEQRVRRAVAEYFGLDIEEIQPDTDIHGLADSLEFVEVVMEIEDEFDLPIPDEAADKLKTVADFVALVNEAKP